MIRRLAAGALTLVLAFFTAGHVTAQPGAPNINDIVAGNTAAKVNTTEWNWTIFIMGSDKALAPIKCVTYLLHPTFTPRVQPVCSRGSLPGKGFPFSTRGWGTFTVGITVDYSDERPQRLLTHPLNFNTRAEGWTVATVANDATVVVPVTASNIGDGYFTFALKFGQGKGKGLGLTSIDIDVQKTGSPVFQQPWSFEILLNDEPWLRVPARRYYGSLPRVRIRTSDLSGSTEVPRGITGPARIHIVAY